MIKSKNLKADIPKSDTEPGPGLISLEKALDDQTSPRVIIGHEQTSLNLEED